MRIRITAIAGLLIFAGACTKPSEVGTKPGFPTAVTATAANAKAKVSWTAPTNDGGHALTKYTVTSSPGAVTVTVSAPATSTTVGELTNGTSYTFTVVATNSLGDSPPSTASNSVIPATVPDAPTEVAATAGNAEAMVSWTAPMNNGGRAVTSYEVTPTPNGTPVTIVAPATSALVSGLDNGITYTFTVIATNSIGDGAQSSASTGVTPVDGTLVVSPSQTFANGKYPLTLTFTLLDGSGAPISGQSVSLSSSETTDVFSNSYGTTDAAGTFKATVTGTNAGTRVFTAHMGLNAFGANAKLIPVCAEPGFMEPGVLYPVDDTIRHMIEGDFNGDRNPDIAVTTSKLGGPGHVQVLSGDGHGGFTPTLELDAGTSPSWVLAGDFNADGRPDLAALARSNGSGSNSVFEFTATSSGSFMPAGSFMPPDNPFRLATGDFNKDMKLDLVAPGEILPVKTTVYLGDGDGGFQETGTFDGGSDPWWIISGDFNGDQSSDLAEAEHTGDLDVFVGNGDGTFRNAEVYPVGFPQRNMFPTSVSTGDFNADGKLDLTVSVGGVRGDGGTVGVLLGYGNGAFAPPVYYNTGLNSESVVTGDFNGDGDLDLVVTNDYSGDLSVLLGDGNGTFSSAVDFDAGIPPGQVVDGDFNGDGKTDLAIESGTKILILLNSCK